MNDFEGLLANDFGFKPQGKSAPMAASKTSANTTTTTTTTSLNFGIQSNNTSRSSRNLNSLDGSFTDGHDSMFGSTNNRKTQDFGSLDGFGDVFGGPPKYTSKPESRGVDSGFDFDSMLRGSSGSGAKSSSLPVYDKPVYDDDIFDGIPGLKSSASVNYDDVFSSISSPPKRNAAFDELLGNLGGGGPELKSSRRAEKGVHGFDDLLPGFGGSSPSRDRSTSEASWPPKSTVSATKTTSNVMEDPFVVLESTSTPAVASSGLFTDPLEEIGKINKSRSSRIDGSSVTGGVSDDIDPLDGLGRSALAFSSKTNDRGRDRSPLNMGPSMSETQTSASKESTEKSSVRSPESHSQKKVPVENSYRESHQTLFDMPTVSNGFPNSVGQTSSPPSFVNASPTATNSQVNMSSTSEDNLESSDDVWLTVSEIPLFTQPTSAPPPSRPPPPRPAKVSKAEKVSLASTSARKEVNEFSSFPTSTRYSQGPKSVSAATRGSVVSQIDELEDFAMGRTRDNVDESADVFSGEEVGTNSDAAASAAAMKEAMDRAEAKFRHAKEVRERENAKAARSKEAVHLEKDENAMQDTPERALKEQQEKLEREWQQREKEEEEGEQMRLEQERERVLKIEREREENEREQRRVEKEREKAREIEREREKVRQAVERATKEARERAAAESRQKVERAAVQRAQAEARERAAADAKQRAEKAAAEARERANAEAREKEARERTAVARAEAGARLRAERAAVQRASAEARERAAVEARERAAAESRERATASAKVNQQKNENDLESFFSMGSRPSSAPRPRANSSDPLFDTQVQSRQGPEATRRTSGGSSSSLRKASSTTNIVDDLTSIFGAVPSSGEFQDVEGESEERRRARLERHQRTEERAAKALAEKNQRDLQAQREQAERHRISETLDAEIKRWAAGKEGNLRALLSTLQYVLWPECGWQPVSLTDLITAASVKKVYRKATLCIHPDKVQQKGANLQQKYVAEKVFDLLKEAWNKFNSEELF